MAFNGFLISWLNVRGIVDIKDCCSCNLDTTSEKLRAKSPMESSRSTCPTILLANTLGVQRSGQIDQASFVRDRKKCTFNVYRSVGMGGHSLWSFVGRGCGRGFCSPLPRMARLNTGKGPSYCTFIVDCTRRHHDLFCRAWLKAQWFHANAAFDRQFATLLAENPHLTTWQSQGHGLTTHIQINIHIGVNVEMAREQN